MALRRIRNASCRAARGFGRRFAGASIALLLLFACNGPGRAQDGPRASEVSVKAAFLYKFASYVQWPEGGSADRAIDIGVVGANEFARELAEFTADRLVSDRPISVRRLGTGDSVDGLDILFIGGGEMERFRAFLGAAQMLPILTVTETAMGLAEGSIINFTLDQERVRFEVSLYAAERSRLKLNARLLAVAQEVRRGPE